MKNDLTCGNLTDIPNDYYRKFFEKFKEIDTLDSKDWKTVHILAYFCKKYKEQYNIDYKFKYNVQQPSKCFEIFQIKRLCLTLSSDPFILKDYIDWVFLNKIIKAKRRITSISFIVNEIIVNEYKKLLFSDKIDRSTILPNKYKDIFITAGIDVNTYGDIAFIFQAFNQISKVSYVDDDVNSLFDKLKDLGFDKSILEKII